MMCIVHTSVRVSALLGEQQNLVRTYDTSSTLHKAVNGKHKKESKAVKLINDEFINFIIGE